MPQALKVEPENWNTAYYQNGNLFVRIFLTAMPSIEDHTESEPLFHYAVTLCEGESVESFKELFQRSFTDLGSATEFMHTQYSHWTLKDLADAPSGGGGCGSCSAH